MIINFAKITHNIVFRLFVEMLQNIIKPNKIFTAILTKWRDTNMKNIKKILCLLTATIFAISPSISVLASNSTQISNTTNTTRNIDPGGQTWKNFEYQNQSHFSYEPTRAIQILVSDSCWMCCDEIKNSGGIDGSFGPTTAKCVRCYQGDHGLTADGSVGPATWYGLSWDLSLAGGYTTGSGVNLTVYKGEGWVARAGATNLNTIGYGYVGKQNVWYHNSLSGYYVPFQRLL